MSKAPRWKTAPKDDDYAAAARYLSLLLPPDRSSNLANEICASYHLDPDSTILAASAISSLE